MQFKIHNDKISNAVYEVCRQRNSPRKQNKCKASIMLTTANPALINMKTTNFILWRYVPEQGAEENIWTEER
jgi:hypothetical protein